MTTNLHKIIPTNIAIGMKQNQDFSSPSFIVPTTPIKVKNAISIKYPIACSTDTASGSSISLQYSEIIFLCIKMENE